MKVKENNPGVNSGDGGVTSVRLAIPPTATTNCGKY